MVVETSWTISQMLLARKLAGMQGPEPLVSEGRATCY